MSDAQISPYDAPRPPAAARRIEANVCVAKNPEAQPLQCPGPEPAAEKREARGRKGDRLVDRVVCEALLDAHARYLRDVVVTADYFGDCVHLVGIAIP
jgi:hypothetical protein